MHIADLIIHSVTTSNQLEYLTICIVLHEYLVHDSTIGGRKGA